MKACLHAAIAATVLCFAATGLAQNYTKQQLRDIYYANLSDEGYRPEVTRKGDIRFKRQGRTYTVYVDEKDPLYFRMVAWFANPVTATDARIRRLESANIASRQTKAVKVFLSSRGSLGISAEFYQLAPGDGTQALRRLFASFDLAFKKYRQNY